MEALEISPSESENYPQAFLTVSKSKVISVVWENGVYM